ncbi:MAG TPA: OmpA family protein [Thermoanaerobaculia bacterium]|nr:OmpA family protein [Thermoanaerobaculia bacterium]HQR66101.1 OmpA family protein [Thermoanaerobaculia bacterium]
MSKARLALLAVLLGSGAALAVKPDKPGCDDPALFPTRMPNYRIEACEVKEFAPYAFRVANGKKQTVEGKLTFVTYAVDDRKDDASGVAVVRNYEAALKKIGGTVQGSDPQRWITGSVVVDGKEAWAEAEKGNGKIWLRIVEKQAMAQHVVADAASFGNDIRATGHVAVYGIYFDTARAVLKPESTPALQEVARLLAADPSLKLWVVGHTDAVGAIDANMKLAQARAEAVVTALTTTHGIAALRLKGYGVGPLAPVASNDSEEGRAKNRRVELVKQ